jgi:hypothetical protein
MPEPKCSWGPGFLPGEPPMSAGSNNEFAAATCPGCGQWFPKLIVRKVDRQVYLAKHNLSRGASPVAVEPSGLPLEDRIRAELDGFADGLNLTHLRSVFSDTPKEELDRALLDLDQRRVIQLEPQENQQVLTAEDRAGAIRLGGEDMHTIYARPEVVTPPESPHQRVRDVYRELVAATGDPWVHLKDLRERLSDVTRDEMDRTLQELRRDDDIRYTQEAFGHRAEWYKESSIRVAGEDMTMIRIV